MVNPISNLLGTEMQATTAVFVATAGLIAGRKFCVAAGCKLGSKIAGFVNEQKAADWNQTGDQYLAQAKKDARRDVAAVVGLVAVVGLAKCAKESFSAKGTKQEEPGYFKSYAMPTIKYGVGAVITGLGLRSLVKFGLTTSSAGALYNKCNQWNGQAEEMGKYKKPIQLVTSGTIYGMQKLADLVGIERDCC